jgi:hypothetical protein
MERRIIGGLMASVLLVGVAAGAGAQSPEPYRVEGRIAVTEAGGVPGSLEK